MKHLATIAGLAMAGAAAFPGAAAAANAFVVQSAELRAGPGEDYPPVAAVPAGTPATVFGCLGGFVWCDVGIFGNRGWLAGEDLDALYQGRRVVIREYGPSIGLPIVGFSFGDYWTRYYRGRPFYREQTYWQRHAGRDWQREWERHGGRMGVETGGIEERRRHRGAMGAETGGAEYRGRAGVETGGSEELRRHRGPMGAETGGAEELRRHRGPMGAETGGAEELRRHRGPMGGEPRGAEEAQRNPAMPGGEPGRPIMREGPRGGEHGHKGGQEACPKGEACR